MTTESAAMPMDQSTDSVGNPGADSSPNLNALLEMGFSRPLAEKALAVTGNQGIEPAMEWLIAHAEDSGVDLADASLQDTSVTGSEPKKDGDVNVETEGEKGSSGDVPSSYKCDDCGKLLKNDTEVEYHCLKTQHQNYSESTESILPLTEEQKEEQKQKLEERIRLRRMEREEQERKSAIENEKSRRRVGQEIAMAKQKFQEEEMKKIAEERRREKMEDKAARQKILQQIEADKQARREKFGGGAANSDTPAKVVQPVQPVVESIAPKKEYDQCKLQIRLTNGQSLVHTFGSNEELAAVRLYIEMNRTDGTDPFSLMTNFPKKNFGSDDMDKPLFALGLVPSAVLILKKEA